MSAGPTARAGRRVRLFVGLHLLAVGLIYSAAWAVGGGFGGTPFPRDEAVLASLRVQVRPADAAVHARTATPAPERGFVPERHDVAPPWSTDDRGAVRLLDR